MKFMTNQNLSLNFIRKIVIALILAVFIVTGVNPQVASAAMTSRTNTGEVQLAYVSSGDTDLLGQRIINFRNGILQKVEPKVVRTYTVVATAYSSTPDQTDDTPCLTANGYDVCEANVENIIAANFLKLKTKVRIPDLYGDQIFTVQDRMHPRFDNRIDLWKTDRARAIEFGKRLVKIEVIE